MISNAKKKRKASTNNGDTEVARLLGGTRIPTDIDRPVRRPNNGMPRRPPVNQGQIFMGQQVPPYMKQQPNIMPKQKTFGQKFGETMGMGNQNMPGGLGMLGGGKKMKNIKDLI